MLSIALLIVFVDCGYYSVSWSCVLLWVFMLQTIVPISALVVARVCAFMIVILLNLLMCVLFCRVLRYYYDYACAYCSAYVHDSAFY